MIIDELKTIRETLNTLQSTVDNFDNSLSSMRFVINGEEFVLSVAPTIDRVLGQTMWENSRGAINTGGFISES